MLSVTSEYALRALVQLARRGTGQAMLGRDLAREANVPRNYLAKILLALRNAGIVDTARGSGGGYRLKKPASQICLIDIVELFGDCNHGPSCMLDHAKPCQDLSACSAHRVFRDLNSGYASALTSTRLADISAGM